MRRSAVLAAPPRVALGQFVPSVKDEKALRDEKVDMELRRLRGLVTDLARRAGEEDVRQRIDDQQPQQAVLQGGGFYERVSPKHRILDVSGTGGSAFGAPVSVTLASFVPAGRSRAWCELVLRSNRSGGDASDSDLEAQWRLSGDSEWTLLDKVKHVHELVDDATMYDVRQVFLPLSGGTGGEVQVMETNDDWFYTLDLIGYD